MSTVILLQIIYITLYSIISNGVVSLQGYPKNKFKQFE